ncbi:regulation of ARF protein signal transduction [Trichomonas vaginalis G3]|uniref:regulation of ARF protein signal transduction n=1 Tax=Trichomonas vaginalis (strain ATCC PRA-98 / G3) TaxID=412133 RepID=UPI0021E54812|nr:regulation of ARF protein signal transduction [Trichomonas vaginalis G3]KAI5524264.1 regulation of ARF protein signal transduction [Trichomonas vaginalis G3]
MHHHLFVSDEIHAVDSVLREIKDDPRIEDIKRGLFSLKSTLWIKPLEEQSISDVLQPFLSILDYKDINETIAVTVFKSLHRITHHKVCSDIEKGDFMASNLLKIFNRHTNHPNFNIYAVNTFQIIYELTQGQKVSPQVAINSLECLIEHYPNLKLPLILPYSFSILANSMAMVAIPLSTDLLGYLINMSRYGVPVQRALCIEILAAISASPDIDINLMRPASAALLVDSLNNPDRTYFVPVLRLFFILFSRSWDDHLIEFGTCIDLLLSFINSKTHNADLRADTFELLADFAAIPNFIKQLYSNFNQRDALPNLSDIFLQTICTIAGSDSEIKVSRQLAIGVVSSIVGQLSDFRHRSQSTFIDSLDFNEENRVLKTYKTDVDSLLQGFNTDMTPQVAAHHLLSIGTNPDQLGIFFSKNDNFSLNCLDEFLSLLKLRGLPFEMAIRVYLTVIHFPGEGQVIDRACEHFAKNFYKKNKNLFFKTEASVHILCFAWLMVHTSLHNTSVTEKTTQESFRSMLKGQNEDEDFEEDFLNYLYEDIQKHPLFTELNNQMRTPEYWFITEQRETVLNLRKNTGYEMGVTAALFEKTWRYAASVFSDLFQSGQEQSVDAFTSSVQIASTFHETHIIDNVFKTFCAFSVTSLNGELSLRAIEFVLRIAISYGQDISDWSPFLSLLARYFQHGTIPSLMCTYKDIVNGSFVLINPAMFTLQKENVEVTFSINRRQRSHSSVSQNINDTNLAMMMKNLNPEMIAQASRSFPVNSVQCMLRDFNNSCSLSRVSSDAAIATSLFLINFGCQIIKYNADRVEEIDAYKLFDIAAHVCAVVNRPQAMQSIICIFLPIFDFISPKIFIKGPSLSRMFSQRKFIQQNIEYNILFLRLLLEKEFYHPSLFKMITCPTDSVVLWDLFITIESKIPKTSLECLECVAFLVAGNKVLQITEIENRLQKIQNNENVTNVFNILMNATMNCSEKMKRFSMMMMSFCQIENKVDLLTAEFEPSWLDFLKMSIEFEYKDKRLFEFIDKVLLKFKENEEFVNKTKTFYSVLKRENDLNENNTPQNERRSYLYHIARTLTTII